MTTVVSLSPLTVRQARAYLAEGAISAPFGSRYAIGAVDQSGKLLGVLLAGTPSGVTAVPGPVLAVSRLVAHTPYAAVILGLAIRRAAASLGYRSLITEVVHHSSLVNDALQATGWKRLEPSRANGRARQWCTSARYFDHQPAVVCLGERQWWQRSCRPQA